MMGDTMRSWKGMTVLLLVAGFLLSITGMALLIHFSYSDTFKVLGLRSEREERFYASFFLLLWIACFLATFFKRNATVAMAAGLLVAIMVYAYPFVLLDTVRRLLEDNPSDDIRQLAAGGVCAYIGALLSFLAPVVQYANFSATTRSLRIFAACAFLANVMGSSLILASDACGLQASTRNGLFSISDAAILIVFLFNVAAWSGLPAYAWLSSAFAASQGLKTLATFFVLEGPIETVYNDSTLHQVTAGCVILWMTMVFVLIASNIQTALDRAGYTQI